MACDSDLHEPRTNAVYNETGNDFRVSFESHVIPPARTWSELVRVEDGLFNRLPTPWGEVWWFDRQWKPVRDPTAKLEPIDLLALAHGQADKERGPTKCYFIGADEGPVKIGYSVDVKRRLRDLQMASPVTLRVLALAPGGMVRESAYHMQFDAHRLHGEWFERSPEILAEIERLKA